MSARTRIKVALRELRIQISRAKLGWCWWRDVWRFTEMPDFACSLCRNDDNRWEKSLAATEELFQKQLAKPDFSGTVSLPIEQIRYTQAAASEVFTHGEHRDRTVSSVANDLIAGRIKPSHRSMVLDVVFWHSEYWSLNNRGPLPHIKVYTHV